MTCKRCKLYIHVQCFGGCTITNKKVTYLPTYLLIHRANCLPYHVRRGRKTAMVRVVSVFGTKATSFITCNYFFKFVFVQFYSVLVAVLKSGSGLLQLDSNKRPP